ncbi:MAG: hypothetical protein FJZ11_05795 [Candidatus Omnitrophica bacterium]|nr:hypothetical protein [Candidatus Omnitrophota bacterium]
MTDQPKEELTTEKAKELLQKEQRENQLKCQVEIQAVLDKYGMQIQGYAIVPANQISIVPK